MFPIRGILSNGCDIFFPNSLPGRKLGILDTATAIGIDSFLRFLIGDENIHREIFRQFDVPLQADMAVRVHTFKGFHHRLQPTNCIDEHLSMTIETEPHFVNRIRERAGAVTVACGHSPRK